MDIDGGTDCALSEDAMMKEEIELDGEDEEDDVDWNLSQTKQSSVPAEEYLPDGRPKFLGKQKFHYGFCKILSMKCVIVQPFKPDLFLHDVFKANFDKAVQYVIKNTKYTDAAASKTSAIILEFRDVDEADLAWIELHRELSSPELTVQHPSFTLEGGFYTSRFDTGIDWLLSSALKEVEICDPLVKRTLLFENVPRDATHLELVNEFPEAMNVISYDYDPESPGMVVIEMANEQQTDDFLAKYTGHVFKGVTLSLAFYVKRFYRMDRVLKKYRRRHQEANSRPVLSDADRLIKVADLHALSDAKNVIVQSYDLSASDKIQKCHDLREAQRPIARTLFLDARRRRVAGLSVPEPRDRQTIPTRNLFDDYSIKQAASNAFDRTRLEREKILEQKNAKPNPVVAGKTPEPLNKNKRPAAVATSPAGHPPEKKFQSSRGRGAVTSVVRGGSVTRGRSVTRGGVSGGGFISRGGFNRGGYARNRMLTESVPRLMGKSETPEFDWERRLSRGMGGLDGGMGDISESGRGMGGFDRGMGGFDRGMGGFDRGIGGFDRGMGGFDREMGGFDRGMGGLDRGQGGFERGMGEPEGGMGESGRRMGAFGSGYAPLDRAAGNSRQAGPGMAGYGNGGNDMAMTSVKRTMLALTNKVHELEMMTSHGGGGSGDYDAYAVPGSARSYGHRAHSAGQRPFSDGHRAYSERW